MVGPTDYQLPHQFLVGILTMSKPLVSGQIHLMTASVHIRTLETLRRAKTEFHNKLCRSSKDPDPSLLQKLRSENVFVLTEFCFLLRSFALTSHPDRLESYITRHNQQLEELIADPARRRLMGLEVPRLHRGIFSSIQIQKARANLLSATPGLDQADIQRLTILLFSPETGRRVIEALEAAGFVLCGWLPFCKIYFVPGVLSEAVLCSAC